MPAGASAILVEPMPRFRCESRAEPLAIASSADSTDRARAKIRDLD